MLQTIRYIEYIRNIRSGYPIKNQESLVELSIWKSIHISLTVLYWTLCSILHDFVL